MKRHLTAQEMAELVAGTITGERAATLRLHLAGCAGCAAAWAMAVRYRAAWLRRRRAWKPLSDVAAALARDSGPDPAPVRARAVLRRWVPAAGVAATIVVVGAWVMFARSSAPTLGFQLPPAVRVGIESSSARELVLPGGERHADRPVTEMRSGGSPGSSGFARELDLLNSRYEAGDRSPDASARLVAALLAAGDLEAAGAYSREALRAHPRDARLLVLMADLKYRASDLAAAETYLRTASRIAPRDSIVGLDLALVLQERGNTREAREWFERVAASGPAPLAERARQELRR